jgi:hypothetical protein
MPVNSEQDCCWLGREVGMQWILIPPFGGSIPPAPATQSRSRTPFPTKARKGRKQRGFPYSSIVSTPPFCRLGRPNAEKSPAVFGNNPVLRRPRPETLVRTALRADGGSAQGLPGPRSAVFLLPVGLRALHRSHLHSSYPHTAGRDGL